MASFIYGTSLANGLKEHVNVPVQHFISLEKNEFILEKAFNELKNYNGKTLVYLMGGIPDNTNKLEGKNIINSIIYQEVVL